MEQTSVQKLARVLRVLVILTFVCNLIALLFVPFASMMKAAHGSWDVGGLLLSAKDPDSLWFLLCVFVMGWNPLYWIDAALTGDPYWLVLTLFLLSCGVCTAVILWQGRRVLGTILNGDPFVMDNAKSMKRAAICCFLISGAALLRLIWGFAYYRSILPLLTYNALFVPIFLMGGLLFLVMSALFRQAAQIKAENDLTI